MLGKRAPFRLLVLLPLLLLALQACEGTAETGPDEAVLLQDPRYIIGAGIYQRTCAGCHGDEGEGRESLGPQINTPEWQESQTDDQIREAILTGAQVAGTSMDAFRDTLTDDEVEAVIVYLRTLRP